MRPYNQASRPSVESDTTVVDQGGQVTPISPQTTFEQILGPATATEQTGRDMVAQQRAAMFQARTRSRSLARSSNKSSTTKKSSSKFMGKIKGAIKPKKSKTSLRALNISKPLPVVPGPRRPERPVSPLSPEEIYFGRVSPARTAPANDDWPLPPPASSSPAVPARRVAAAAAAAAAPAAVAARAALPSGMILATPGLRSLAPAREGGYASVQTPTVVAPVASATVGSLKASLAGEGGAAAAGVAAGEDGGRMVAEMTEGELREVVREVVRGVVREQLGLVRDELGETIGAVAAVSAELAAVTKELALLRGGLARVEGMSREQKAGSAFSGGRYPGQK